MLNTATAIALNEVSEAFRIVMEAVQNDQGYAWAWHCNIAMASVDEGIKHKAANRAAARFMKICFDVDTTKFREYRHIMGMVEA